MVSEALAAKFCMRTVRNQPRRGLTASQRDTRENVSPSENQMPLQTRRELPLRGTDRCEQTLHLEKTNMTIDSLLKKRGTYLHVSLYTRGSCNSHHASCSAQLSIRSTRSVRDRKRLSCVVGGCHDLDNHTTLQCFSRMFEVTCTERSPVVRYDRFSSAISLWTYEVSTWATAFLTRKNSSFMSARTKLVL